MENIDPLILQNDERHATLKNIELNGEHQILQQDEISQGIKDLNKTAEDSLLQGSEISSSLEEIAKKNTDFQVIVDGADMAFYKGEKGEKGDTGNTFDELTESQKEELRGRKGEDGINGIDGLDGEKGEKGDKGEKGEKGWRGEKGDTGEKGDKGDTGEKGEKGDKGDRGEDGKSLSEEKVKEIENIIQFASKITSSSKTVSLSELDDVNLSGLSQTNGKYNLGSGASGVQSIVAGTNISVDNTDPANPIVSSLSDRYKTTSTTSQAIVSTGSLTFTVGANLAYTTQQDVIIAFDASNHMHGTVTSYSGTTLIVDIQHKTGSGTYSSWTINLDAIEATPVTVTDSSTINLSITSQDITADVVAGSIGTTQLSAGVNTSLGKADTAVQPAAIANFETTTQLNTRDTNNRARANHTGTQLASTISDFASTVRATVLTGLSVASSAVVAATDTILVSIGKLQAQNTAQDSAIALNTAKVTNATHTGDVTGATALTLATVNANVGSFGLAGSVAQFTVNAKGLITAAANVAISITSSAVTDFATTVRATTLTGLSLVSTTVISATDTVLVALGSLQAQITALATATLTFTNKRNQPRIVSAASYTTNTGTSLDISTCDIFIVTAQAGALLFNAPSGTPVQGEKLIIRIKDNGTARALTWNSVFRAMGNALPSTTVLSKTLYLGLVYNSTDTKWDLIASAQEA